MEVISQVYQSWCSFYYYPHNGKKSKVNLGSIWSACHLHHLTFAFYTGKCWAVWSELASKRTTQGSSLVWVGLGWIGFLRLEALPNANNFTGSVGFCICDTAWALLCSLVHVSFIWHWHVTIAGQSSLPGDVTWTFLQWRDMSSWEQQGARYLHPLLSCPTVSVSCHPSVLHPMLFMVSPFLCMPSTLRDQHFFNGAVSIHLHHINKPTHFTTHTHTYGRLSIFYFLII